MKKYIVVLIIVIGFAVANSCKKEKSTTEPYIATPYSLYVPKGFPPPVLPADNPLTVEGIRLGRMLFYDPILSTNGKSCSSCHQPEKSFSSAIYVSVSGDSISVPPHINLAWNPDFTWNGSCKTISDVCMGDFAPPFFNSNMPVLIKNLKNHATYPALFKQAFNIDDISTLSYNQVQHKIVDAVAQFLYSMVSYNSKFDRMMRHEANFTAEEWDGYETFYTETGDCFHCHNFPLCTSNTYNNNGLDSVLTGQNLGRYLVTGNVNDQGKFSAPTLRNIELTAPYMHDGRFQTLEEVVDFYNSGVHWNSPNVDPIMTKPAKLYGLNLTPQQKANLVTFLKTMTDTTFLNNPDYKSPF